MGNAFITKGSTITIGLGSTDIKANIIEDFDIGVGDQQTTNYEASDGSAYVIVGEQDENNVEMRLLLTNDTLEAINNSVYGAGSTLPGGTEWEMRDAGGTVNDVTITAPQSADGTTLTFTAVNAKGVVFRPAFMMKKGYEGSLKFVCDYWKIKAITA